MTEARTPVPPLVCEFIITLRFRLSTQKKKRTGESIAYLEQIKQASLAMSTTQGMTNIARR